MKSRSENWMSIIPNKLKRGFRDPRSGQDGSFIGGQQDIVVIRCSSITSIISVDCL